MSAWEALRYAIIGACISLLVIAAIGALGIGLAMFETTMNVPVVVVVFVLMALVVFEAASGWWRHAKRRDALEAEAREAFFKSFSKVR